MSKQTGAQSTRPTVLSRLRRLPAWCVVPATALVGVAVGAAYGESSTPQYAATSYVIVVPTAKADPTAALGFATAYGRVAEQVAVLADAQVWAGVPATTLKKHVTTATSPDAPMISVTGTASSATTAVNMADGVARALVSNGTHLQPSTNVRVLQFSRAVKPTAPSSPSTPLAMLVGGCGGGLLGGLGLLVRPKRRRGTEAYAPVPGPTTGAANGHKPQPQPETV
jgi:capsular polysaccharide biosynthesis protein